MVIIRQALKQGRSVQQRPATMNSSDPENAARPLASTSNACRGDNRASSAESAPRSKRCTRTAAAAAAAAVPVAQDQPSEEFTLFASCFLFSATNAGPERTGKRPAR